MTAHRSFCRICIGVCGVEVEVDDGRAVTVRGVAEHPISRGYTCTKGRALGDLHAGPQRLDGPWMRDGGDLVPATWDAVLGDLGSRLADVGRASGPGSIGFFMGNGMYFDAAAYWAAKRLQRALGTTHLYSNMSIDSAAKYRVGELMAGTYSLTPQVAPDARLVLMLGTNPVVSHGQLPMFQNPVERLRASARDGDVWVVDPRTTESARLANHHLPIRPGTDHALLAFLVRAMLPPAGTAARAALAARAVHADELAAAVAPYTLERAAELTGLPAGDLSELLAAVRRAGRLAVLSGTGVTMSSGANAAEWLVLALLLVTDSLDRPGGMWCNPGYLAGLDRRERLPSTPPPAPGPPTMPGVGRLMGEWPAAAIPAEIEAGNLRALVVLGGNLVTCLPDTNRALAALRELDALVVLEVAHTDTTALATHVLATHAQLERPDVSVLTDLYNPIVATQLTEAVLPRHPGRRSGWWVLARLGEALGVQILPAGLDAASGPWTQAGRSSNPDAASDLDVLRLGAGEAIDALAGAGSPWAVRPTPVPGWVDARLPHGCWDLAPAPLADQLATLAAPPPLVLTPRRQARRVNGQAVRGGERADVWLHPADAAVAGVGDGDLVDVASTVGSVRLPVVVTEATRPGAASIPHGWADANVNALVDSRALDPLTGMPGLSGTAVTVRPAGALRRRPGAPAAATQQHAVEAGPAHGAQLHDHAVLP